MADKRPKRCGFVWPRKRKEAPAASLETTHAQGDESHRCGRPEGHTGPHRCALCYASTPSGVTAAEQPRCGYTWRAKNLRSESPHAWETDEIHRCNRPWPHTGPHRCEKCSARAQNCPHKKTTTDQSGKVRCMECWTPLDDQGRQKTCHQCGRPFWTRNVGPHCQTCQPSLPMEEFDAEPEPGAAAGPAEAQPC